MSKSEKLKKLYRGRVCWGEWHFKFPPPHKGIEEGCEVLQSAGVGGSISGGFAVMMVSVVAECLQVIACIIVEGDPIFACAAEVFEDMKG